jgi:hypothetical protein
MQDEPDRPFACPAISVELLIAQGKLAQRLIPRRFQSGDNIISISSDLLIGQKPV